MDDHYNYNYADLPEEKTEVIYGVENFINYTLDLWSKIKNNADICADCNGPSLFVTPDNPLNFGYRALRDRGIKLRYITEITKDNIHYCKELMKICDLRHLDEIKGNFGVGDGLYYRATAKSSGPASTPPILISCTVRAFVEQQQFFFDMLWKKAIPAKKRIIELEENIERPFINTIADQKEILEFIPKILSKASREILILFSNITTIDIFEKETGILRLLEDKSKNGVSIRILINVDNISSSQITKTIYNKLEKIVTDPNLEIKIQNIEANNKDNEQSQITIFVVDKDIVYTIETNNYLHNLHKQNKHELGEKDGESESIGKKDYNAEEIGLATYSNSKSTVLSYRAIFDSLWRKTELYQKLEMANQQLKENEILHKDFIHIAAHELKNPLQPILSLSSFLKHILNKKGSKDVLIDKKQANEIVDLIIKNTNKMIRLTNDILDMTRIETKTFSLCKEKVDLMILLSDILSDYNTLNVDSSNIKTSYYYNNSNSSAKIISNTINTKFKEQNYNNGTYLVEIDKSRISQVITNLLDNAYKFTDNGDKIYVDINLKNKDNKKFVVVTIKDTGKGIDFDIAPKLFAKFATKSNKGTGLGLFICKNIIEAHGGSIWGYNNDDGKGATFGFSLPLLPLN